MEDDHFVVFGDDEDLAFFHVLTEGYFSFLNGERVGLYPFVFHNHLSPHILVDFPQGQKVYLVPETISQY